MSITTVKVLRTISKIILLIVGIGIIGYGGLMVYKSVVNKPQRVRITNVTDSATTITWVTDNPVRGIVYYKDEGTFLPGPLGFLGSKVAYDDRDFARAQDECVKAFNENAKNTKDTNFTVDGSGFDCENIPVEKLGAYYTHSVTIKNLNESSTYFFVVGNGIWSWSVDGVDKNIGENDLVVANSFNFKTAKLLEEVSTPNIAYGTVYAGVKDPGLEAFYEDPSKDSLVFGYAILNGADSQLVSAVTNASGGWILDKSNLRDAEGNLISDLTGVTLELCAQYENVSPKGCVEVTEDLEKDTVVDLQGNFVEDLTIYEKDMLLKKFGELLNKVYAMSSAGHDMDRCTDSGVSGCSTDAKCIEKCPVTGTDLFDWVDVGTVSAGDCELPSFCGDCTEQDAANGCNRGTLGDGKSKKCIKESGGYFWTNYSTDDCSVGGGGNEGIPCEDPETGNLVQDGKKCSNGVVCKKGDCNDEDGVQGPDPTPTIKVTCKDKYGATINEGKPCPISGGTCKSNGKCESSGGGGDGTEEEASNTEYCTVEPLYSSYGDLVNCIVSCEDGKEIYMNKGQCSSFSNDIPANGNPGYGEGVKIVASKISLPKLNLTQLKNLVEKSDDVKNTVIKNAEKLNKEENKTGKTWRNFEKYCQALGGTPTLETGTQKYKCLINNEEIIGLSLIGKAYAQNSSSDGYTIYLPEYGMYSFQLGDYQLTTDTTGGNTYYIFYIEANDKKGFQMPADLDNPTEKEDIVLSSNAMQIQHKKVASAQAYTLNEGINLISFNFIPVSTELGPLTAKGVIDEATKKGVTIQYISSFDGGRWAKGYTCKNDKCSGNDFNILPGKGYLVYATKGGEMTIPGYNLKSSIPVNLSGGWNLVGIHGYTTAYTARTLIDSMNKIDRLTANNVTWWPTSKGMYEGLQVTEEQQYGFDFPISPTNGYFVRISSFQPEDSKCKSLLWNEGGTLNGACGVTK